MLTNGSSSYNDGVKCTVDTCKHYEAGNRCAIKTIEVNSCTQSAAESDNTMCQSFKPKSNR